MIVPQGKLEAVCVMCCVTHLVHFFSVLVSLFCQFSHLIPLQVCKRHRQKPWKMCKVDGHTTQSSVWVFWSGNCGKLSWEWGETEKVENFRRGSHIFSPLFYSIFFSFFDEYLLKDRIIGTIFFLIFWKDRIIGTIKKTTIVHMILLHGI